MNSRINVEVETSYLPDQSYTITVRNDGDAPARLMQRHWLITDANGKTQEVHGDGVLGEQPHLQPGQGFRYSSGTVLETPVGAMQGRYEMLDDDGRRFDAPIPAFRLSMPGILH
jgi:ApaG protein